MTMIEGPPVTFDRVLHGTATAWNAWMARALAAEALRARHQATAQARQTTHPPCEDPFCATCVPFGQHLELAVQRRRRAWWAAQDRERAMALAGARRQEDAEGLQDLRGLREAAGLTQAALAARVGITRESLGRIEAGKAAPRRTVVDRLRAALGPVADGSRMPRESWPARPAHGQEA